MGKWATYRKRGTAHPGERFPIVPTSVTVADDGDGTVDTLWVSVPNPTSWKVQLYSPSIGGTLYRDLTKGATAREDLSAVPIALGPTWQARVAPNWGSYVGAWVNSPITAL